MAWDAFAGLNAERTEGDEDVRLECEELWTHAFAIEVEDAVRDIIGGSVVLADKYRHEVEQLVVWAEVFDYQRHHRDRVCPLLAALRLAERFRRFQPWIYKVLCRPMSNAQWATATRMMDHCGLPVWHPDRAHFADPPEIQHVKGMEFWRRLISDYRYDGQRSPSGEEQA